jgi:hypothetical protein
MGYRRRSRYRSRCFGGKQDTTYTVTLVLALFFAGFFCFGVTWIAIPFAFAA